MAMSKNYSLQTIKFAYTNTEDACAKVTALGKLTSKTNCFQALQFGRNNEAFLTYRIPAECQEAVHKEHIQLDTDRVFQIIPIQSSKKKVFLRYVPFWVPDAVVRDGLKEYGHDISIILLKNTKTGCIYVDGTFSGTRIVHMTITKDIPANLKIGEWLAMIRYDGQPKSCNYCKLVGHMVITCPELFCNLCDTRGHNAKKCPAQVCLNCKQAHHHHSTCTEPCGTCHQPGHIMKDCNNRGRTAFHEEGGNLDEENFPGTDLNQDLALSPDITAAVTTSDQTKEGAENGFLASAPPLVDAMPTVPVSFSLSAAKMADISFSSQSQTTSMPDFSGFMTPRKSRKHKNKPGKVTNSTDVKSLTKGKHTIARRSPPVVEEKKTKKKCKNSMQTFSEGPFFPLAEEGVMDSEISNDNVHLDCSQFKLPQTPTKDEGEIVSPSLLLVSLSEHHTEEMNITLCSPDPLEPVAVQSTDRRQQEEMLSSPVTSSTQDKLTAYITPDEQPSADPVYHQYGLSTAGARVCEREQEIYEFNQGLKDKHPKRAKRVTGEAGPGTTPHSSKKVTGKSHPKAPEIPIPVELISQNSVKSSTSTDIVVVVETSNSTHGENPPPSLEEGEVE